MTETNADTAAVDPDTRGDRRRLGSRRLLLGAVAGLLLAGVAVLMVTLLRPDQPTPGDVIRSAREAANAGDYSKANGYLSSTAIASAQAQGVELQALWDQVTHDGQLERVEILQTTTRGETTIVRYRVSYRDGTADILTTRMVKERGAWKEGFDLGP